MSRVGSKEINIPESVKINLQDGLISAEGPLGKLETKLNSQIAVSYTHLTLPTIRSV